MALPTVILNPTQQEAKRFTGRKGQLWIGSSGVLPTASVRPGYKASVQNGTATGLPDAALFSGGAVAVAATWVVTLSGTPTVSTLVEIQIPIIINSVVRTIYFGYQVQSSDTTALVATALKSVLTAGNDNTAIPSNSYIKGLGPNDTFANLKTGMNDLFGTTSSTAFTTASSTLTLTLGTVGTAGNNVWAALQFRNSNPNPLTLLDSNGNVQLPGFFNPGDFTDFGANTAQNSVNYIPGNTLTQVQLPTTTALSSATGVYFNVSSRVLENVSNALSFTGSQSNDVGLFGGSSSARLLKGNRLIFVFDNDLGGFDLIDFYKCFIFNLDLKFKGDAAEAIALTVSPQPIPGRIGDPFGYLLLNA